MTDFKGLGEQNLNNIAVAIVYDNLPEGKTNKIKTADILGQNAPYDILWNDIKLCVRIANESNTSRFPKWNYTVKGENREIIDFYIFLAIKDNEIYKVFVLPPEIIPETTVTVTEKFGEIRYSKFTTTLETIPEKISDVKEKLPDYMKMYKEIRE